MALGHFAEVHCEHRPVHGGGGQRPSELDGPSKVDTTAQANDHRGAHVIDAF